MREEEEGDRPEPPAHDRVLAAMGPGSSLFDPPHGTWHSVYNAKGRIEQSRVE